MSSRLRYLNLKLVCQTGVCFIYMASNIDEWLPKTKKPDILKLASVFFTVKILATVQDIVVDGWSLTMLKRSVLLFNFLLFRIGIYKS